MPNSHTEVFVHYVWATWDRLPLVTPDIEAAIYACIRERCRMMQAHLMAIGGMPDHVHVLIRLPATRTLAQVVQDIKGASAHLAAHQLKSSSGFRWQGAYFARAVAPEGLDAVIGYIENQKQHHARKTTVTEWERSSE